MSKEFRSFLQGLLQKNPKRRLNWPHLLDHPFVKMNEIDRENMKKENLFYSHCGGDGGPRARLNAITATNNSDIDMFGTMNIRDREIIGDIQNMPHYQEMKQRKNNEVKEKELLLSQARKIQEEKRKLEQEQKWYKNQMLEEDNYSLRRIDEGDEDGDELGHSLSHDSNNKRPQTTPNKLSSATTTPLSRHKTNKNQIEDPRTPDAPIHSSLSKRASTAQNLQMNTSPKTKKVVQVTPTSTKTQVNVNNKDAWSHEKKEKTTNNKISSPTKDSPMKASSTKSKILLSQSNMKTSDQDVLTSIESEVIFHPSETSFHVTNGKLSRSGSFYEEVSTALSHDLIQDNDHNEDQDQEDESIVEDHPSQESFQIHRNHHTDDEIDGVYEDDFPLDDMDLTSYVDDAKYWQSLINRSHSLNSIEFLEITSSNDFRLHFEKILLLSSNLEAFNSKIKVVPETAKIFVLQMLLNCIRVLRKSMKSSLEAFQVARRDTSNGKYCNHLFKS